MVVIIHFSDACCQILVCGALECAIYTYSAPKGFGASNKLGRIGDDPIVVSSIGVPPGVGEAISICAEKYGCLWGRGEISILSFNGPGDEEGNGGVVAESILCQHLQYYLPADQLLPLPSSVPKRFDVNKDRRGVGNWGL